MVNLKYHFYLETLRLYLIYCIKQIALNLWHLT